MPPVSSSSSRTLRSRLRPVFLSALAATAVGGTALYISIRPRNIPGSDPGLVPPPKYGEEGVLEPPRFPKVRGRGEQIRRLKKSAGRGQADAEGEAKEGLWGKFRGRFGGNPNSLDTGGQEEEQEDDERVMTERNGDIDGQPYDLLIIGGGATGAGIALDAVTRGLKVALVEKDDFASGTSSKSTKLVHGGVRYLEKAVWDLDYNQYKLVREALRERKYFLETAPHLSMWLPIMIPIKEWWQAPYYWAGTKFYDFLAGAEGIESSYFLTKTRAMAAFPMLRRDNLWGALVYYDGAHNDSRMNVSLAMTAALYGATVVNHMEITSLEKDAHGKLIGARAKDLVEERDGKKPQEFSIKAKGIINATGPFTDSIRKMDDSSISEIVAPSSGVHVILPGYYSPSKMGLIDPKTSDGRVIFFLPWEGNTIAGTTDAPTEITHDPIAGESEINWILSEIRGYLAPDINVRRGDVLAAWSGIRPLVKDPHAANTESLVRNHLITTSESGLLTCAGGKWTTYRQMAEETVDEAIRLFALSPGPVQNVPRISGTEAIDDAAALDGTCQTHQVRLLGAHGFRKTLFIQLVQHFGLATDVARHLGNAYGDRAWTVAALCAPTPDGTPSSPSSSTPNAVRFPLRGIRLSPLYPFVDGEVRYAVRHEYAHTAVDVLARRTRLAFLNARAALDTLPAIIDLMAADLHWSPARRNREWRDAVRFLESMGLEKTDVEELLTRGKLVNSGVGRGRGMYDGRFDAPADTMASDFLKAARHRTDGGNSGQGQASRGDANPVMKLDSPVNK